MNTRRIALGHPTLEGEGKGRPFAAAGGPGWGDSDAGDDSGAVHAEAPSHPPGPLTRADLPPAEPRCCEGSATLSSDRSRAGPTSVGGGESRPSGGRSPAPSLGGI